MLFAYKCFISLFTSLLILIDNPPPIYILSKNYFDKETSDSEKNCEYICSNYLLVSICFKVILCIAPL